MKFVAEFLFDKGILGEGAPSPEFVGVSFPDGSIYGDTGNVKLKFDPSFMTMARRHALGFLAVPVFRRLGAGTAAID